MSETKTIIQMRRGNEAGLPAHSAEGEPLFCLDTHRLFVGMGDTDAPVAVDADAASIGGVPVNPATPIDGQALVFDAASGTYKPQTPSGDAESIRGVDVDPTPPSNGQVLVFDSTLGTYKAKTPSGNATSIQSTPVDPTAPINGQVLVFNSTTGKFAPATLPPTNPGGSNKQLEFNDGGVFAGVGGSSWDKTNKFLTMSETGPLSGAEFTATDGAEVGDIYVAPGSVILTDTHNGSHNEINMGQNVIIRSGLGVRIQAQPATGTGTVTLQDKLGASIISVTSDSKLGFFNNPTPVTKPAVSGSRNNNPAVASAVGQLASLGLVTDSTTQGVNSAEQIQGVPVDPTTPTDGAILIFDVGTGKYIPGDPIVSGPDAVGATPTKNPVQVAGVDGGGLVRRLKTDATGVLAVSQSSLPLPAGAATEASLGTDGASAPSIPGTGIRGWLRSIYDKLAATLAANIAQWGGVNVSAPVADAPAGTETAPVYRTLQRKFGEVLSTTPPALSTSTYWPGGVTSPTAANWYDTQKTGAGFVYVTAIATTMQFSGSNTLAIEETDDPNVASQMSNVSFVGAGMAVNTLTSLVGVIRKRYYRIRYTTGTVSPAAFEITRTESALPPSALQSFFFDNNFYLPMMTTSNNGSIGGDGAKAAVLADDRTQGGTVLATGCYVATGNPTSGLNAFVAQRTATTFKTVSVAATATGNSAVWTPTSGKKFRLMKFQVTAQGLAATAAAVVTVSFQDATTGITIGTYDVLVPAVAGVQSGVSNISGGWVTLDNGLLSALANNVLNFNISAAGAGTVGTYRINVAGTEE